MKHLAVLVFLLLFVTVNSVYASQEVILDEMSEFIEQLEQCRVTEEEVEFYKGHMKDIDVFIQDQAVQCEEAVKQSQPSFWDKVKSIATFGGGGFILGVLTVVAVAL